MATDKPRFSVTFTDDCYMKIQKYKKANKISTQSKAVARLVEIALDQIETESGKGSPSEVFVQHDPNTHRAFSMYMQLDEADRGEIRGMMMQMLKAGKYKNPPCIKGKTPTAV